MFCLLVIGFNPLFFVTFTAILHSFIKIIVPSSKCCRHVIRNCPLSFDFFFFFSFFSIHDLFDIHCSFRILHRRPISEFAAVCTASLKLDHLTSISSVSSRYENLLRTFNQYLNLVLVSFSLVVLKIIFFSACFSLLNFKHILVMTKK